MGGGRGVRVGEKRGSCVRVSREEMVLGVSVHDVCVGCGCTCVLSVCLSVWRSRQALDAYSSPPSIHPTISPSMHPPKKHMLTFARPCYIHAFNTDYFHTFVHVPHIPLHASQK